MKLKESLKTFLSLTKGERNGFFVLCVGMVLGLIGVIYFQWVREPAPVDMSLYQAQIDAFMAAQERSEAIDSVEVKPLFAFDPNTLDTNGWSDLGFTDRQVASIMKYIGKGGSFRSKSDLKKLYAVDDERYAELEPFIDLPEKTQKGANTYTKKWPEKKSWPEKKEWSNARDSIARKPYLERAPVMVELNAATEAELATVRGIGEKTAGQIIKYRSWLGGFVDKEQLKEVYAFKNFPDHLPRIMEQVHVDPSQVIKHNVNTEDAFELAGHPYLEKKIAGAVVAYRKNHGEYKALEDIKKCALIDDALFRKLAPYLSVE